MPDYSGNIPRYYSSGIEMRTQIGHLLALLYGQLSPPHPGRWRLMTSMIQRFRLRRPRTVTAKRRGAHFRLDMSRYLDNYLYYLGYHDYAETRFLERNLRSGDVFLDVGANIGYYTLLAARKVAPSGQVHAFEISQDDFARLETNVRLNSFTTFIRLNRVAVSDAEGEVRITPTFDAGANLSGHGR